MKIALLILTIALIVAGCSGNDVKVELVMKNQPLPYDGWFGTYALAGTPAPDNGVHFWVKGLDPNDL